MRRRVLVLGLLCWSGVFDGTMEYSDGARRLAEHFAGGLVVGVG